MAFLTTAFAVTATRDLFGLVGLVFFPGLPVLLRTRRTSVIIIPRSSISESTVQTFTPQLHACTLQEIALLRRACRRSSRRYSVVTCRAATARYAHAVASTRGMMSIRQVDAQERFDEIADNIRDLKTNVEEIQSEPPGNLDPESLNRLKSALEHAIEASDELENDLEEGAAPHIKE